MAVEVEDGHSCRLCGPTNAVPGALVRPGVKKVIPAHRLYVVVSGTTWRLWWAPRASACRDQVRALLGGRGFAGVRVKVRRATKADLVEVGEWRRK